MAIPTLMYPVIVLASSFVLPRIAAQLRDPTALTIFAHAGEDVDARSDVYALGAVLYFTLTGGPPFDGKSTAAILMAHMRDAVVPPSLRSKRPVPRDLDDIVTRCLEKEPSARYPSAAELADALAACSVAGHWSPTMNDVPPSSVGDATHEDAKTITSSPPRGAASG